MKPHRLVLAVLGLALAGAAQAGDPNARDWLPAPAGTNVIVTYFANLKSHGFYEDGKRLDGSPKLDVQALIYRQMHYSTLGGKTVQYEIIVPGSRSTLRVPGESKDRLTGIGDVVGGMAVWLHEGPEAKNWFAMEGFVTVPTGRYRSQHADVSPGNNRWTGIVDFAFVKGLGESTFLEAVAEVEFFGKNDNYYGQTLKKAPALRLMALASTNLTESTYVGARYRFETGGREKINGETVMRRARNHQLAAEITHQINDANQIQLQYIHDLKVENGPRMRGVQLRYAYVF